MTTLVCAFRCDKGANTLTQNALFVIPAVIPPALTVIFFSQMSPASAGIVGSLAAVPPILGILAVVGFFALLGFLARKVMTKGELSKPIAMGALLLGILALILRFPAAPCFVAALATLLSPLLVYSLHRAYPLEDPWIAASIGLFLASVGCAVLWVMWLLVRLPYIESWTDWTVPFREMVADDRISWKIAFVAWVTPAGVAFELLVMALLCQMRSASYNSPENQIEAATSPMTGGDEDESFSAAEFDLILKVRQLGLLMCILVIILWVDASVSSTGEAEFGQKRENMRDEVFGLAFWFFSGICIFMAYDLGLERVHQAAKKSKMAKQVQEALESDWVRAFFLFSGAPVLALLLVLDPYLARLHDEIPSVRKFTAGWPWTSLITKAQWWGIAYVSFEVGGLKVTTVLLAMINDSLKSWPVGLVCFAMFLLGTALFLLPPTPGVPVYMVVGIVVTASAENAGWSFSWGVALATFVAFSMKLAFVAVAQKGIGEPMAKSVAIRRMVGVNTVEIRAIEKILASPTVTFGQVMILIGGPDWPAAVLCGLLRLSIKQCLLATSPVLLQSVFPCVLAGALQKNAHDNETKVLADTSLAIAGLLQMVALALAAYVIQEVIETDYDQLVAEREEDRDVVALAEKDEEQAKNYEHVTQWEGLPAAVQKLLISGLISMEVCMILLMGPWKRLLGVKCFKKFDFMSTVEKDLGGNPLSIVEPLGWVSLIFCALSCMALSIFNCWAKKQDRSESYERASLSNDESDRP
mmetsp:Transcript_144281/g.268898  ORF Transcript_144281/g.268898 Transcript_144281/m.268898 type:complete len:755 (-) Transcript_144281:86-2350(-)